MEEHSDDLNHDEEDLRRGCLHRIDGAAVVRLDPLLHDLSFRQVCTPQECAGDDHGTKHYVVRLPRSTEQDKHDNDGNEREPEEPDRQDRYSLDTSPKTAQESRERKRSKETRHSPQSLTCAENAIRNAAPFKVRSLKCSAVQDGHVERTEAKTDEKHRMPHVHFPMPIKVGQAPTSMRC